MGSVECIILKGRFWERAKAHFAAFCSTRNGVCLLLAVGLKEVLGVQSESNCGFLGLQQCLVLFLPQRLSVFSAVQLKALVLLTIKLFLMRLNG